MWGQIGLTNAKLAGSIPVWLHHNACLEALLKRTDEGHFHTTPHHTTPHHTTPHHTTPHHTTPHHTS